MITEDYTLPKKIVTKKYNYIQSTDFFPTLTYKKNLTAKEQKDIKSFNNYDKEVALAKISDIANPSEHAYFLYDTQNLIRENFISEINKQVNLIGRISFFDKIAKDGKMQLKKTTDKLKFDVKKNAVISYLEFNLSPNHASKKINFRKREVNNLMVIGTVKLAKAGQKRKVTDIVDTLLIKALQSYDKYTILNPLEVNLRSNYLNQKLEDYKGFVYEVMIKNILFSSSIKNETQNIFVTCQNLNRAKKALINEKIYSMLDLINLKK